jgi:hypothetical protein
MSIVNLAVAIFLIQIPSIIWAWWSFNMHRALFREGHHSLYGFTEHASGTLFTAGVCPFGKLGAWMLLLWTIIFSILLLIFANNNDRKNIKKLGIVHVSLVGLVFLLSLIMNKFLFIRTIPYFIIQIGIGILLIDQED